MYPFWRAHCPFRDPVYGGIQVSPNGGIKLAADMLFSGESEQFALDDQ